MAVSATGRVPFGKHHKDEFELLRAMRNPRIKPLAVLRPGDTCRSLSSMGSVVPFDRKQRSATYRPPISPSTVRAFFIGPRVRSGQELAALLDHWKRALERTVKRAPEPDGSDSSPGLVAHTLRYEEVALAFDDEAQLDAPTIEAHALPSDPGMLAAKPVAEEQAAPDPARRPPPPDPSPPQGWGKP